MAKNCHCDVVCRDWTSGNFRWGNKQWWELRATVSYKNNSLYIRWITVSYPCMCWTLGWESSLWGGREAQEREWRIMWHELRILWCDGRWREQWGWYGLVELHWEPMSRGNSSAILQSVNPVWQYALREFARVWWILALLKTRSRVKQRITFTVFFHL